MKNNAVGLAEQVAQRLEGRSLATGESCTAGRIATAIASVANAVEFFRGGLVAYQVEIKQKLLDVSSSEVLSLEAAEEMATGAARLLRADVAVASTGLVGGVPEEGVPVGTVFIGTIVDGLARSRCHTFSGDPQHVCEAATQQALQDLLDALSADPRNSL